MKSNLRIKGIVKTTTRVKNLLSIGIQSDEVNQFKHYIQTNVEAIENICAQHGTQPDYLPARSRNAYYFLKEIDLDNLPIISHQSQPLPSVKSSPTIPLRNIVKQQRGILEDIFWLANNINSSDIKSLIKRLNDNVVVIENICEENNATPANLSNSSRQIYAWMKFLTNPLWLEKHLITTNKTKQMAEVYLTESEKVFVSFVNTASLYKSQRKGYQHNIVFNEGFITADENILKLVIANIFEGKTSQRNQIVRQYVVTEEYTNILLELDLCAEIDADKPQGQCYDLNLLFDKINLQYFDNSLSKPRLSWSSSLTRKKFGHYESHRDKVVISLSLDNSNIPSFVPEFVLYHELLHKYCGEEWVNGQRRVHTPEFKRLEQQFECYQQAEAWLSKIAHFAKV